YDSVELRHEAATVANNGTEVRRGRPERSVSQTKSNLSSAPQPTDPLWLRITCDGSSLAIDCIAGGSEPTDWSGAKRVYTTSDFDFTGGMIGFMAAWRYYELGVDDLKVWSDRDGDGAYETLEHQDFFTLDDSGYAPQGPEHDAAG